MLDNQKVMRKGSKTLSQEKPAKAIPTQKVYKLVWNIPWKAEHVLEEEGDDLFRPAKPEEVIPELEEYFFQPKFKQGYFYRQKFSHLVDWKTVVELCETHHLFVRKDFNIDEFR